MGSSKRHAARHRVSVVVGAILVAGVLGVACDETVEATKVGDAGGSGDATSGGDSGSNDGSQSNDGTSNTDSTTTDVVTNDVTTDSPTDSPSDVADAGQDVAQNDTGSDAADAADAGPPLCTTSPIDADTGQIIAIEYVAALEANCSLSGFYRTGAMLPVEDCFGVFLRQRIGCAGANYATALDTNGAACGGYFVHSLDGANFSNADFDAALATLETALDIADVYTNPTERAAVMAAMSSSRSLVVTSNASGLTHNECDAGP